MTQPSAQDAAAAFPAPPLVSVDVVESSQVLDQGSQQQHEQGEQRIEAAAAVAGEPTAKAIRPDLSRALTVNLDAMTPVAPLVAAEVVCRHVSAEVLGVPDAVQLISDFADYARVPFMSIPRACELRQLRLAKRIAAREASAEVSGIPLDPYYRMLVFNTALVHAVDAVEDVADPNDEGMALVRWLCKDYCPQGYVTQALERAARQGKLSVIEWIVEQHGRVFWFDVCANAAAGGGHVAVLEWFLERDVLGSDWMNAPLADASQEGHVEVVQWLLAHGSMGFINALNCAIASGHAVIAKMLLDHFGSEAVSPMIAMRVAAANNQLEILQWVHEQVPDAMGSPSILDTAVGYGHLAIVEWLAANRDDDGRSQVSINIAAANGHLDILKWLHVNRSETCTTDAMDSAAANGHLEIVQWLHANRTEGCTTNAMDRAAAGGHLEIVKWLHENRKEGCTFRAMNGAAQFGYWDTLLWLHEHRPEKATVMAMTLAASNGHLDVIKWLHETLGRGCTANAPVLAAEGGHLEVLKWLHANIPTLEWSTSVMDAASSLPVLRWLHEMRIEGCTTRAMDDAASRGMFDKALFLDKHYPDVGCTPEAASLAIQNGHIEMFMWLCENYPDAVTTDLLDLYRPMHRWAQVFELFYPSPVESEQPEEQGEQEQELAETTGAEVSTVAEAGDSAGAEESAVATTTLEDASEQVVQAEPEAEAAVVRDASDPLAKEEEETSERLKVELETVK